MKGKPSPTLKWFKDNKPVKKTKDIRIEAEGDLHRLVFEKLVKEDIGSYSCTAKNSSGEVSQNAVVKMRGEESTLEFTKTLEDIDLYEGIFVVCLFPVSCTI